jgi:hypothetical protein
MALRKKERGGQNVKNRMKLSLAQKNWCIFFSFLKLFCGDFWNLKLNKISFIGNEKQRICYRLFLFPKDLLPNSENLPQKKSLSCAFVDQNIYIFCHFQN